MDTYSVSEARANLYHLVDQVNLTHHAVALQGKRHDAVMLSAEDYNTMQEMIYLSTIPGMRESIVKGLKTPLRQCSKKLW